jgi:hypothetical protein
MGACVDALLSVGTNTSRYSVGTGDIALRQALLHASRRRILDKTIAPDVIACLGKAELFRFFSFAYET